MKLTREGQKLMEQIGGSFASALAKAYLCADLGNKARIESAFPELIQQYNDMAILVSKKE